MKCEAITDRVQVMSLQYGYFETMKQAVFQMLHYSFCIQFPKEEWHVEEQWRAANQEDVDNKVMVTDNVPAKVGDMIKVVVKEGLRFHAPHPSRVIRDLNYAAQTFNTDSGCEYSGDNGRPQYAGTGICAAATTGILTVSQSVPTT